MVANLTKIRKNRLYSVEFKLQIVKEFENGQFSVLQLEKLYGVSNTLIYIWIYKYSKFNEKGFRIVEKKESGSEKLKQLEKELKDIKAALGEKQMKIDYLETLIEIASEDLKYDIKKNSSTQQLKDSEKKRKN
jgi:transposase